jgi:hypothetical protein
LMFGRLAGAALVHLHAIARRQDHVDQADLAEFFKYPPRLITESALTAAGEPASSTARTPENTPG